MYNNNNNMYIVNSEMLKTKGSIGVGGGGGGGHYYCS